MGIPQQGFPLEAKNDRGGAYFLEAPSCITNMYVSCPGRVTGQELTPGMRVTGGVWGDITGKLIKFKFFAYFNLIKTSI